MSDTTLYELLGISRERAQEIARAVRESYSRSEGPAEWVKALTAEFEIGPTNAEVFACGWFAGRYAGVSEVFKAVSDEMDKLEKEREHPPNDGYA